MYRKLNHGLKYKLEADENHIWIQIMTKDGMKNIRLNSENDQALILPNVPEWIPELNPQVRPDDQTGVDKSGPKVSTSENQVPKKKGCGCKKRAIAEAQSKNNIPEEYSQPREEHADPQEKNQENLIFIEDKDAIGLKKTLLGVNSVGFGDTIKLWIETVSFGLIKQKPGCGCQRRQHLLNKWFPYKSTS